MSDGAEYSCVTKKKKSSKAKRRFSDDQIRSLEVMFETETKLEPKQKVQVARELGLQPRQVAIWFQNKRARWKSKHLEKDYGVLLADYNNLASQFEVLAKEKQSLLAQLQKLKKETVERKIEERGAGSDGESDNCRIDDFEVKDIGSRCLAGMLSVSDDDRVSIKAEFMGLEDEEDNELLKMVEPVPADSSLTSAEDWGSLDSDDMIMYQASDGSFQWWDFWS